MSIAQKIKYETKHHPDANSNNRQQKEKPITQMKIIQETMQIWRV